MTTTTTSTARPGPLTRAARAIAGVYRRQADRLDPDGATHGCNLSFTFEPGIGMIIRADNRGCRLGWPGDGQFGRATADAAPPRDTWVWLPWFAGRTWPPAGYVPVAGTPPLFSWPESAGWPSDVTLRTGSDGLAS
jgi:hypothetical protein